MTPATIKIEKQIVKNNSSGSSILAVLIFIAIVSSLTYFVINKVESFIKKEAASTLSAVLKGTENRILEWETHRIHNAESITFTKEFKNLYGTQLTLPRTKEELNNHINTEKLRNFVKPHLDQHSDMGFFIITPDYINIASMRDKNTGEINLLKGKGYLEELFTNGTPFVTPPFASDVPLPSITGELKEKEPTMFVGIPLYDEQGLIEAALTFRLVPHMEFTNIIQSSHIGETGETYGFNKAGFLITESRYSDKLREQKVIKSDESTILNIAIKSPNGDITEGFVMKKPYSDMPLTEMAESALSGECSINTEGYINYLGKEVVGVWLWSDKLNFAIATEVETSEIYASLKLINQLILFLLAATILLGYTMNKKLKKSTRLASKLGRYVEKLSNVVEQTPAAMFITDLKGNIEYSNPAFLNQTGYGEDEIKGKNIKTFEAESIGQNFYENLSKTLKNGGVWIGDITALRADGKPVKMHLRVSPLLNDLNVVTNFVAVAIEGEDEYSDVKCADTEDAVTATWQWNFVEDIFDLSEEGQTILGINHWEPELGLNEFLCYMGLEHFEPFTDEIKKLVSEETDKFEYRHTFLRPDGTKVTACEIVHTVKDDPDNKITKISGIIHAVNPSK